MVGRPVFVICSRCDTFRSLLRAHELCQCGEHRYRTLNDEERQRAANGWSRSKRTSPASRLRDDTLARLSRIARAERFDSTGDLHVTRTEARSLLEALDLVELDDTLEIVESHGARRTGG